MNHTNINKSELPSVGWEFVDPGKADEYLKLNIHNRSPRLQAIKRYSADIDTDNWEITGDTVKFNCNGEMFDGQNRLLSIKQSGKGLWLLVVRGVNGHSRWALDIGARRTFGNFLQVMGEKYPNELAAALTMQWKYDHFCLGDPYSYPTFRTVWHTLRKHKHMRESAAFAAKHRCVMTASLMTFIHHNGCMINAKKTEEFLSKIKTGTGLSGGDPARILREKLIARKISKTKSQGNKFETTAWAITALNACLSGKKITSLRYDVKGSGQKFPRFIEGA